MLKTNMHNFYQFCHVQPTQELHFLYYLLNNIAMSINKENIEICNKAICAYVFKKKKNIIERKCVIFGKTNKNKTKHNK